MSATTLLTQAPLHAGRKHKGAANKPNEDHFGFVPKTKDDWRKEPDETVYVAVVADGVTSKAGGSRASELAVNTIQEYFQEKRLTPDSTSADETKDAVEKAIQQANKVIRAEARQNPDNSKMSTTLVMATLVDKRLHVAHMGDSRAYLIRNDIAHCLTVDHTLVQEAIDAGQMNEDEAKEHPNRTVINRFLGIEDKIHVDHSLVDPNIGAKNEEDTPYVLVEPDDVILLCSDGLTDQVSGPELVDVINKHRGQPQKTANALVQIALDKHETDNITAVVVAMPGSQNVPPQRTSKLPWIAIAMFMILGFFFWTSSNASIAGRELNSLTSLFATNTPTQDSTVSPSDLIREVPTTFSESTYSISVERMALTSTVTATAIDVPTATSTATRAVAVVTATALPTETEIPTPPRTETAASLTTAILTNTPENTATLLPTETPPDTATPLPTATSTNTPTQTPTHTPRATATPTPAPLDLSNPVLTIEVEQRGNEYVVQAVTGSIGGVERSLGGPCIEVVVSTDKTKVEVPDAGLGQCQAAEKRFSNGALRSGKNYVVLWAWGPTTGFTQQLSNIVTITVDGGPSGPSRKCPSHQQTGPGGTCVNK